MGGYAVTSAYDSNHQLCVFYTGFDNMQNEYFFEQRCPNAAEFSRVYTKKSFNVARKFVCMSEFVFMCSGNLKNK